MTTPAQVLERAADLIDEYGWTQGMSRNSKGNICAAWAISLAVTGREPSEEDVFLSDTESALHREAARLLAKHSSIEIFSGHSPLISQWNDEPERTQEEVTGAMRKAAREKIDAA